MGSVGRRKALALRAGSEETEETAGGVRHRIVPLNEELESLTETLLILQGRGGLTH